jgi:hypothetical protein
MIFKTSIVRNANNVLLVLFIRFMKVDVWPNEPFNEKLNKKLSI